MESSWSFRQVRTNIRASRPTTLHRPTPHPPFGHLPHFVEKGIITAFDFFTRSKAGIQSKPLLLLSSLDSRLRGNDIRSGSVRARNGRTATFAIANFALHISTRKLPRMKCVSVEHCRLWLAPAGLVLDEKRWLKEPEQAASLPAQYVVVERTHVALAEFSRRLLDWLPAGRERLLIVSDWSGYPPDQRHIFETIRKGCGIAQC